MAPDVCYFPAPPVPTGPGGIPTPYPNIGSLSSAKETTTKVFIRNKLALVEGSYLPSSKGDEPGCSTNLPPGKKGLASMENKSKVTFEKHSGKVKLQGKGAITQGAPTKHNDGNTMGNHSTPSQTKVSIGT